MRKLLAKPRRTSFAFRLHSFTLASAIISAVAAPTPENEPHDVRVTEHHGVRMLSDEVAHIVQSRETVPASWCDSVPNTHHTLDTKGFCLDGRSCWPPMYLLSRRPYQYDRRARQSPWREAGKWRERFFKIKWCELRLKDESNLRAVASTDARYDRTSYKRLAS